MFLQFNHVLIKEKRLFVGVFIWVRIVLDFTERILSIFFHFVVLVFLQSLATFKFIVDFVVVSPGLYHKKPSEVVISTVLAEPFSVVEKLRQRLEPETTLIAILGLFLVSKVVNRVKGLRSSLFIFGRGKSH